ncbi:uncharacterized protein LOC109861443 [Pseudomyrmex gracilis]|uniref:uncharacterized protein LOC109861443 n=1 Tax=Pseudomyrmex gracilis TaxID=219809 RepID=UPI000994DE91|nr:uncharacterized protein LOC109861443 [Pseudomyrmex gracilis]
MKKTKKLSDFGITEVRPKRDITGELIIEIPGEDSKEKADRLCVAMSALASASDVRVARPVKTVELRVKGLDDFVTPEEVKEAVVATGSCRPTDVKVGRARASPSRLLTAWVQCPVSAAKKIADAGALRVGWVRAPIEVLERRPMQCHQCLRRGHVMATCTYTTPEKDRRGRC